MSVNAYLGRRFELWAYTVSLGRMLLRSIRDLDGSLSPRNLDIRFVGVAYTELPTSLSGLSISNASPAEAARVSERLGRPLAGGEKVFALVSAGVTYYVVASGWSAEENDLGRMESRFTNAPPN